MRQPFVALITLTFLATGCISTKHVIQKVRWNKNKTEIQSPKDVSHGLFFALPRTVVTVKVPVERKISKLSEFLKDVRVEIAKEIARTNEIARLAADAKDAKDAKDATTGRMINDAIEAIVKDKINLAPNPPILTQLKDKTDRLIDAVEADRVKDAAFVAMATRVGNSDEFQKILQRLRYLGIKLSLPGKPKFALKKPSFNSSSEPDPNEVYYAEVSGSKLEDRMLTLEYTESGTITGGESRAKDRTFDTVVKGLEVVAGIAGAIIKGVVPGAKEKAYAKAKQLLFEIEEIRMERLNLRKGSSNFFTGGGSVDLYMRVLKELNRAETERVRYFDTMEEKTWVAEFELRPEKIQDEKLFEFSSDAGLNLLPKSKLVGLAQKDFIHTGSGDEVSLTWDPKAPGGTDLGHQRLMAAIGRKMASQVSEERGFPYRVPPLTHVSLIRDSKSERVTLGVARLAVAQFGPVLTLPSTTGHSDSKFIVSYYAATGMLKKVVVDSKSIDGVAALKSLGDSAKGTIEARQDREVERLRRRKEKLELEKAIQDLTKPPGS